MNTNYSNMTVGELKEVVKAKNLTKSIKGYYAMKKADLISQLDAMREIHAPIIAEAAPVDVAVAAPVEIAAPVVVVAAPVQADSNVKTETFANNTFYYTVKSKAAAGDEYESPLAKAIEQAAPANITLCREKAGKLDQDGKPKAYKSYGNMSFDELTTLWKNNNHLYEVIRAEHKPYFDIEFKFETEEHRSEVFVLITQLLTEAFAHIQVPYNHTEHSTICYNLGQAEKGIFAGMSKVSYHLIVNNGYKFISPEASNKFSKFLRQLIKTKPEYAKLETPEGIVIDLAVYNKNRCFKLPYQSKVGSTRAQVPIGDKELGQFLISYGVDGHREIDVSKLTLSYDEMRESLRGATGRTFEGQAWNHTAMEEFINSMSGVNYKTNPEGTPNHTLAYLIASIYNGREVSYRTWFVVGSAIKRVMVEHQNEAGGLELFTQWTRKYDPTATVERLRPSWQTFSAATCGFKTLLGLARLCNPLLDAKTDALHECLFKTDSMPADIPEVNVSKQFIEFADFLTKNENADTYFIKSAMGTGKTFNFIKYINEQNELTAGQYRVIYLSSRRAFAESTSRDFESVGLKNYISCGDVRAQQRVIISLESLTRLSEFQVQNNDLLIIDESESIFNIISSQTLIKTQYVEKLKMLYDLIRVSKKVFVMDAFLTNRSIKSVMACRPVDKNNTVYYNNVWVPQQRQYMALDDSDKLIAQIKNKLRAGKRCVLVSGSSSLGHQVVENCKDIPDINIKFYHSRNQLNLDVNVNTEWSACNLLIYSPTITCGISYTNADRPFDNLFIYAVNKGSCHFRDIIQAHKRVRKFTDPLIHIMLNTNFQGFNADQYPCEFENIREIYHKYRRELFSVAPTSILDMEHINWIYDIHCYNIQERNIHSKYLWPVARKYFEIENIVPAPRVVINVSEAIREIEPVAITAAGVKLITRDEFVHIGNLIQFRQNTEKQFQQWFKFRVWNELEATDAEKVAIFEKYVKTRETVELFDCSRDFKRFVAAGGIHTQADNDILEIYETRKIQYTHLFEILSALGVITKTDGVNKLESGKEWNTASYTPELIAKYAALDRKTINQLFSDEYMKLLGKFSSRTMGALLSKLCQEVLGWDVKTTGEVQKRIEGKKTRVRTFKLSNEGVDLFKHF